MKAIAIAMTIFLVACSNRSVYEGLQESNRQACNKMPEYQRQECLHDLDQSYDEYQREREALKNSTDK